MHFDFDGRQYAKASPHQKEWGQKLIAELLLRGNEHILDLGCGDGILTAQLAALVPGGQVVGIDSSVSMIQAAREHQAPNLKFAVSDINELNFQEQFDVVFSNATLHWIKDHQNLLRRVFQSLRHNGMARFNFAGDGNCAHFNQVVQAIMCQAEYAAYFQSFDWPWYMPKVEDYRTIAGQFQFREVQVWNENADRYFPDAKALIRWIDQPSLVPFLARVDTAAQGRFRANVIKAMLKATRQPDGRCFETFRRLNLLARK